MRAKQAAATGGRAYGYDNQRHPVEPAASIVRELFKRHAEGESMLSIASDLNARGISSPGAAWKRKSRRVDGRSALHAIFHNEIYIGRLIWNRSEWIKDPDTGRRIRRERPRSEWIVHEIPALAIVDRDIWDGVQRRLTARAESYARPGKHHGGHRRFLLSGLLECGLCGAKMIIKGTAPRQF